jgi:hypothetical protein
MVAMIDGDAKAHVSIKVTINILIDSLTMDAFVQEALPSNFLLQTLESM